MGIKRPDAEKIPLAVVDSCDCASLNVLSETDIREIENEATHATQRKSEGDPNKRNSRNTGGYCRSLNDPFSATAPELISVTPGRELGPLRLANPHQLETLGDSGQSDLIGRNAKPGRKIRPLTLLDGLPTLFDGRQIPTFTLSAHHPQSPLCSIECESPADRKMLDRLVCSEAGVAEQASRIH
jgi:hypothetical protein